DGGGDRLQAGPPPRQRGSLLRLAQANGSGGGGTGAAGAGRPPHRGPPARAGVRLSDGPRAARAPVLAALSGPAVLLGVLLAVFGSILARGDAVLLSDPRWDMLLQYLPWRVFGFGEIAHGNLPLWNPHIFAGRPFLGDFQSALLYPPNLIHLLL